MEFDLPEIGAVEISDVNLTLNCKFFIDFSTFQSKTGKKFEDLSENIKLLLRKAVETKEKISLSELEKMELIMFFMSVNVELTQIEMKNMRICGATHFIPPKKDDE
jgi:hypothetical protein